MKKPFGVAVRRMLVAGALFATAGTAVWFTESGQILYERAEMAADDRQARLVRKPLPGGLCETRNGKRICLASNEDLKELLIAALYAQLTQDPRINLN